jgi:ribonucleoside-diphosphate reductase alpha chain
LAKALKLFNSSAERVIRNAQVSVLAPTGTIGLLMDCDTTGVEPDLALVKYKQIHGTGGSQEILVNQSVPIAMKKLGYSEDEIEKVVKFILENNTVEGSLIKLEHLAVFDTSLGKRSISWQGHLNMMAAVQPFLSGAISKTINMPRGATVEDVKQVYLQAWNAGLKAVAIYRDGSKGSQPVNTKQKAEASSSYESNKTIRTQLPAQCSGDRVKLDIGGFEVYVHTGNYSDGRPGEIFISASKSGSTLQGLLNCLAISLSLGLQYQIPLSQIVAKLKHQRFEPQGLVEFPGADRVQFCTSIIDAVVTWLERTYISASDMTEVVQSDSPFCSTCGAMMVPSGTCHKCLSCGNTSGCS